jgi:Ni,Fe-hydrogenase III component G
MDNETLRLLATLQKILYDVITILHNKDNSDKPFEIGCKCKNEEAQLKLYQMLLAVFVNIPNIYTKMKETEDDKYIVCVSREFPNKSTLQLEENL